MADKCRLGLACPLATEKIWFEKSKYHDAEKDYYEHISKLLKGSFENKAKDEKNSQIKKSITVDSNKVSSSGSDNLPAAHTKVKKGKKSKNNANTEDLSSQSKSVQKKNDEKLNQSESSVIEEPKNKTKKKKSKKTIENDNEKSIVDDSSKSSQIDDQSLLQPEKEKDKKQKTNNKNKGPGGTSNLVSEIAKARQHIKNSLEKMDGIAALAASPTPTDVVDRLTAVERENVALRDLVDTLKKCCKSSEDRIKTLEKRFESLNVSQGTSSQSKPPTSAANQDEDDDGVDLFASDSEGEDEEAAKIREARLAEYAAKKSKKPALIAKSSILLDVKPWDDETDLKIMEQEIRKIVCDGLLWGASKFQPVAFGIQKLSISCVVEDEKVSIDWLTEEIEKNEDFVQSVDVAAFNKI